MKKRKKKFSGTDCDDKIECILNTEMDLKSKEKKILMSCLLILFHVGCIFRSEPGAESIHWWYQ